MQNTGMLHSVGSRVSIYLDLNFDKVTSKKPELKITSKRGCWIKRRRGRRIPPPSLWGHSHSIPQGTIFDVQPFVKSLFWPIKPSSNGFFDSEASIH